VKLKEIKKGLQGLIVMPNSKLGLLFKYLTEFRNP